VVEIGRRIGYYQGRRRDASATPFPIAYRETMAKTPTKKTAAKTTPAKQATAKTPLKAAAKKPAKAPAKKGVKKSVKPPPKKAAKKAVKRPAPKAVKKVAKKPAAKPAKKPVKKAAAEPAKKSGGKAVTKTVQKVAPKAAKKVAPRKVAKKSEAKDRWAEIRSLLGQRRAELVEEAHRTIDDSLAQEKEQMAEIGDRATEEIDDTFQSRLQGREAKLIAKIDETLARIARGDYGLCESCGEEIAYERLLARPVATLCIDCKTAQERREKNYRA